MKPKTFNEIKDRLWENLQQMEMCNDDMEYNMMESENETMEWICNAENKGKDFREWRKKCAIGIQCMEDEC